MFKSDNKKKLLKNDESLFENSKDIYQTIISDDDEEDSYCTEDEEDKLQPTMEVIKEEVDMENFRIFNQ